MNDDTTFDRCQKCGGRHDEGEPCKIRLAPESRDDGGQAFPMHERDDALCGMTLRDYFAAKAMPTLIGYEDGRGIGDCEQELGIPQGSWVPHIHWPIYCAKRAYAYADAMLAARKS